MTILALVIFCIFDRIELLSPLAQLNGQNNLIGRSSIKLLLNEKCLQS